jgi:predicted transcriptional regulator
MADAEDKALVARILSSYLSNNSVAPADLPTVIETVKKAFAGGAEPFGAVFVGEGGKRQPAVPIKKSITPEAIACLCCGDKFKSLKRHLQAEHELTPEEYRAAFDLERNYPLVAPDYASKRSALAKSLGLGRKPAEKTTTKRIGARASAARKTADV